MIASTISRPLRQILEFVQPRQTWRHMMHYSFLKQLLCFIQISFFSLFFALVPSYRPRDELAQKRCLRRLIPLHLHWLWLLYNFLKDESNFTKIRYQNMLPLEQISIIFWCLHMFVFLFVCFLNTEPVP